MIRNFGGPITRGQGVLNRLITRGYGGLRRLAQTIFPSKKKVLSKVSEYDFGIKVSIKKEVTFEYGIKNSILIINTFSHDINSGIIRKIEQIYNQLETFHLFHIFLVILKVYEMVDKVVF